MERHSTPSGLFLDFGARGSVRTQSYPVLRAEKKASSGAAGTPTAVLLLFGNLGSIVLTFFVQIMLGSRFAETADHAS